MYTQYNEQYNSVNAKFPLPEMHFNLDFQKCDILVPDLHLSIGGLNMFVLDCYKNINAIFFRNEWAVFSKESFDLDSFL